MDIHHGEGVDDTDQAAFAEVVGLDPTEVVVGTNILDVEGPVIVNLVRPNPERGRGELTG